MSRNTRKRVLFAGLVVAVGASSLGGFAQARTSVGVDRNARAEALGVALDAYAEAAKSCDINVTREAYHAAETIFNTVEVDFQFASPERYNYFEHVFIEDQVPSGLGLEGDDPYDCATNVALADEQAAAWDEVISYLAGSHAESRLFDDVATMRSINQGIRLARAEIDGNAGATPQTPSEASDPAAAAAHWADFVADYPVARELIAFRNEALATQVDSLVANVTAAFTAGTGASQALAALAPRFSLGINLITAAARNSIPSESTQPVFNADAFSSADFVGDLVLTFFEIRDLIAENTPAAAAQVQTEYLDWLQYPLSFKTGGPLTRADAAMTTAVTNYVAAQTPQTTQALKDALLIVEQVFVGQYWGTPELEQFYAENETPSGPPVLVATLSPDANVPPGPAGATGSATVEIDADAGSVCHTVIYDSPEPLTMAHIHRGLPGVNGPVVVNFQVVPSGQRACVNADPAVLREIVANPAGFYVNLHSENFPSGVLRGVLSAQ